MIIHPDETPPGETKQPRRTKTLTGFILHKMSIKHLLITPSEEYLNICTTARYIDNFSMNNKSNNTKLNIFNGEPILPISLGGDIIMTLQAIIHTEVLETLDPKCYELFDQ
jgi:hypothetical protein